MYNIYIYIKVYNLFIVRMSYNGKSVADICNCTGIQLSILIKEKI